jgi:hypothetical protein
MAEFTPADLDQLEELSRMAYAALVKTFRVNTTKEAEGLNVGIGDLGAMRFLSNGEEYLVIPDQPWTGQPGTVTPKTNLYVRGTQYTAEELRLASDQPHDAYHRELMKWAADEIGQKARLAEDHYEAMKLLAHEDSARAGMTLAQAVGALIQERDRRWTKLPEPPK